MGFNFPNSPTVGQKWPASPIAGQPTYTWDGEKWTTVTNSILTAGAVRYDLAQGLTAPQQAQGAANISGVMYTPQVLTAPQQLQARQNIFAAPIDAMMNNNLIINGAFEVNQPAVASVTASIGYFCDGWMLHMNNAGGLQVNAAQVLNAANFPGLPYFCRIQPTTAEATLTGGDGCGLYARIEGWRLARLNWGTPAAVPVTLGFWSNHTLPGLYPVAFRSGAGASASYVATYTHNVSAVAQYNVITVPGCTIGTWTPDNTLGLTLTFGLGYGPSLQAPAANVWYPANYASVAAVVNACASTSNLFRITGVSLYPGSDGPLAANAPLLMRPFDQELLQCRRYFYNGQPPLRGLVANSTAAWRLAARHPVAMRAVPAVTITSPVNMFDGATNTTMSAVVTNYSTIDVLEFDGTLAATVAGRPIVLSQGGAGNINVDARL